MLNFLPGPLLYAISSILLVLNTFVWGGLIFIGGLIKLLVPWQSGKLALTGVMNRLMWLWATGNGNILKLVARIEWDVQGLEHLDKNSWYLVISNHLSGLDIAVHSYLLRNHIPMLKYFLKKELLYVPVMGLSCWALDMPFMNRTSPAKLKRNPKLKGKDLASTRRACEKFRYIPTSIMNYVEGTRFTEEKRQRQNSPYRYLLRPKAGGIAFALSAMGEQFTNLLNITVVYPDAPSDILAGAMKGKLSKVVVRIEALPVPEVDADEYFTNSAYRATFQRWLNQLWRDKDEQIHQLLLEHNASTNCYALHTTEPTQS